LLHQARAGAGLQVIAQKRRGQGGRFAAIADERTASNNDSGVGLVLERWWG